MESEVGARSDYEDPGREGSCHKVLVPTRSVRSVTQRTRELLKVSTPCPAVAVGDHQQASLASASGAAYLSSVVTGPMGGGVGGRPREQGLDTQSSCPQISQMATTGGTTEKQK